MQPGNIGTETDITSVYIRKFEEETAGDKDEHK
jgi:hypothetical protein